MPLTVRLSEEVAARILCLAAIVSRAQAEDLISSNKLEPRFVGFFEREPLEIPAIVSNWLDREHLTTYLSANERSLMERPAGTWARQSVIDGWWRREALMVLEWSCRIIEPLPAADAQIPMEDVLEGAWLLKSTSSFLQTASLRAASEIHKQRDKAEFWLWRSRHARLQNYSDEKLLEYKTSQHNLRAIVDRAASTADKRGEFKSIEGDFPAFGKAFRNLSAHEHSLMNSISTERLYAFNWLCTLDGLDWDHVRTST